MLDCLQMKESPMLTESSQFVYLVPVVAAFLVLMARLDLYLASRRGRLANARYLAQMNANSRLQARADRRAADEWRARLIIGPTVVSREPGLVSRRRVISDRNGQTLAFHYEEVRLANRSVNQRLMLVA
jgi:hypothetical protein